MSTTIQIKRSSTASAIPVTGDIAVGELAVNLADKRLYTKQSDGTIIELSTNPTDLDAATLRIDGVEITASATELNSLDGFTGSTTELNILDGLTATTIELNTLDGITASTAELNKLDGYTGSTTELNILDGVTATTAELNYVDGVTSNIQTQLNNKQPLDAQLTDVAGLTPTDGSFIVGNGTNFVAESGDTAIASLGVTATATELNTLDGITSTTAELNILDGVTATATEINVLDGITATTAELNITDGLTATTAELNTLDGITASTLELNYTDGVTSNIQTQLNGKATTAQGALADSAVQPNDNVSFGTGSFSGAVDVTGTVTADGLTLDAGGANQVASFSSTDAGAFVYIQDNNALGYYHGSSSGTYVVRDTDNKNRINIASNGDVSFYEDTGTTAKMVWDASAESLGIGTVSPQEKVHVSGTLRVDPASGDYGEFRFVSPNGSDLKWLSSVTGEPIGTIAVDSTAGASPSMMFRGLNNVERMRIDSAGNVGIGTSTGTGTGINLSSGTNGTVGDGSGVFLSRGGNNPNLRGAFVKAVNTSGGSNAHALTFGTSADSSEPAERVRIDSAGNVGIGTASPSFNLQVADTTESTFRVNQDGTGASALQITAGNAYASINSTKGGQPLTFGTSNSERARIDSSGNLLVGTTSSSVGYDSADAGIALRGKSGSLFSRDNSFAISANRNGNDGEIINLRKDGSTVGSIGTYLGDLTVGNEDTGLLYHNADNAIKPWHVTANVARNGVTDLGDASHRFKDLYLSGGVYLGGTGAANKLDDYEEGVWTPSVGVNNFSASPTTLTGSYTKVGRVVTARLTLQFPSTISMPNYSTVNGLPFSTVGQAGTIAATNTVGSHARVAVSGTTLFFAYLEGTPSVLELVITYETL